jgi:hypothetical protein
MAKEPIDACVQPARGPVVEDESASQPAVAREEKPMIIARVGQPAPDFEASAFVDGGFKNVRLSDYKGHWVVLCFYPGDFTFV